jgi:hypothetical protein
LRSVTGRYDEAGAMVVGASTAASAAFAAVSASTAFDSFAREARRSALSLARRSVSAFASSIAFA